ncbi:MAG: hypothetical protein AB7D01_05275 [Methanoculleus sp.]
MNMKVIGISVVMLALLGTICAIGIPMLADDPLRDDRSDLTGGMKSTSNANLTYTVSVPFPSTPEQVTLYKSVKPEITAELVSSMAEKMGLEGTVRESYDQMLLSDEPYSLEVHMKSGRVALIDIPRWMNPNDKNLPSNLPSDEKAIGIATRYLEKTGLAPPDAILCGVDHPQIVKQNENGEVIGIAFEDVLVSYSRTIDGRPVVGSKLTVEVGGGGDILNVYKLWRDYVPQEEIPIITPEEALEELKVAGVAEGLSADITGIELGYYEAPATREPTHLVPVYIFTGKVLDGTGEETSFVRYVPASPEFREEVPAVK